MLKPIAIVLIALLPKIIVQGSLHPTSSINQEMSCEEFGKSARFNPYSVVDDDWFVFYHWGGSYERTIYRFHYPTAKELKYLKYKLENATVPVNWTSRMVLMKNVLKKVTTLIVENGDRGEFWLYRFQLVLDKGEPIKLKPESFQFKQTGDGRYIGFMNCEESRVYALCKTTAIPRKRAIPEAAAQIGYRGRGGLSYLYQGHQWAPVDEADEVDYWMHPEIHKKQVELLAKHKRDNPDKNAKVDTSKPVLFPEQRHV